MNLSFAFILALSPLLTIAATDAQADLDAWEATHEESLTTQHQIETDVLREEQTELFPAIGEEEGSTLEESRDDRIAAFVSVDVGGKLLVLRDVPRSAWFAPYVREIAERKIVSGYSDAAGAPTGLFGPGDNVTIEQMAKVMQLASGTFDPACPVPPVNVTASGSWSAAYISCAEQKAWAVYGDGTVDVHRNATRSEVIVTLLQAFNVQPGERTGEAFEDVSASTQFGAHIEKAKTDGIVSGYTDDNGIPNGLFGPEDPVTRAEFAKIVTLGMQVYGQ